MMDVSGFELEQAVLETIVPELEADGYRVVIHPSKGTLPTFLGGYTPDMVAYKGDQKLAVEVVSHQTSSNAKAQNLRQLFMEHPDWTLRLIYAPPMTFEASIPVLPRDIIADHLKYIEANLETMGLPAALLTGWGVFEAAARAQLPANLRRPQPPARLIEALASGGYITPNEADALRRLSRMRNEIAHGRLDLTPPLEEVTRLMDMTRVILELDPTQSE